MFPIVKEIRSKTGILHFQRRLIFCIPKKNINLFLHRISKADEDLHEHDHPWSFYSLILSGGYVEQADGKFHDRRAGSLAKKNAEETHKIHKLLKNPTYTLVLTFGKRRLWGFKTEHGWLDFQKYRLFKRTGKL